LGALNVSKDAFETSTMPRSGGVMYVRSFTDLDGHHWEVGWMDAAAMAPGAQG
jgi:predicted lactoylglutathione lyase